MSEKKIPLINEKFDFALFLYIVKKSVILIGLLIGIAIFSVFAYLRYTLPTYKSSSIIQINTKNQTNQLLNIENVQDNNELAQIIELIRSTEFLKRTFNKLPFQITYFSEGTFLKNELYKNEPFSIEFNIKNNIIYDVPIYIDFIDKLNYNLSYTFNENKFEKKFRIGDWIDLDLFELKLTVSNYNAIIEKNDELTKNNYFFIINNPANIIKDNLIKLKVNILNPSAQTIDVSFTDNNATKTSDVVNTISEEFLKYDVEKKKESDQQILAFIEDQEKLLLKNIDETEQELHNFKAFNKIETTNQDNVKPISLYLTKFTEIETEILNIEFEYSTLKRINEFINKNSNLNILDLIAILSGTKSEGLVVSILNKLQDLINQKEILLNDVTKNNHQIQVIDKQVQNQKMILIEFISSTLNRLESQKEDYKKKLAEYEEQLFSKNTYNEIEFAKLNRIYSINEGFYNQLIEKKAQYLISQAGFVSQNIILEKAVTPLFPISPDKKNVLVFSVVLLLLTCIGFIVVRYLIYNEITGVHDIKEYTAVPILGAVPLYKTKVPVSQLLVHYKPNSMFAEAFRTVRSNMQFIKNDEDSKLIAISSTISGEGKTFIAVNLGGILAISGKKVIILDMDLRKPRIHLSFSTDNSKGMSTILIGKNSIADCIRQSDIKDLQYITAGPVPPNPSELAMSRKVDDIINELKPLYDFIIIDTPPLGIVTDAISHFQRADFPIYVMKANFSKRAFIHNLNHLLNNSKLTNLSVVLNGIDVYSRYGGYGYRYAYGYGYGYGYGSGYGSGYYEEKEEKKSFIQKLKFWNKK